jgi:hypothetical protein
LGIVVVVIVVLGTTFVAGVVEAVSGAFSKVFDSSFQVIFASFR